MAAVATAALTGCGSKESKVETTEFVDDVKVALADSGRIDLNALQWTREPKAFEVKGDTIAITTAPHTDLWQRTYYHFQNDNAPVLQMKTKPVRHRDVSGQRELAERFSRVRER